MADRRPLVLSGGSVVELPVGDDPQGGTAWVAYTPTISAGSGTLGSVSATGFYKLIGKSVFLELDIVITNNGNASGNIMASLPFQAAARRFSITGRESNAVGFALTSIIQGQATTIIIQKYDGTYPGGTNYGLVMTGVYEAAS